MGFLDLFRKSKKEHTNPPETDANSYYQYDSRDENDAHDSYVLLSGALTDIARIVTGNDAEVMQEVSQVSNIRDYYSRHQELYLERGLDESTDPVELQWLTLVDILEEHNYVCERDWKDEKDDFIHFFGHLKNFPSDKLTIDPSWLREDGDIAEWCTVLNEKWKSLQYTAAAFDIESDSYVLFPCKTDSFTALQPLAELFGRRFDIVGESPAP